VPIEFLRGVMAVVITYFISQALNIFDIETRRKIEEQARLLVQSEKLSSLGQLAAGIAHEINNPLTNASLGIQTLKQRLCNERADSDMVERLAAVEKNIDRASLIAQELLQFSRRGETEFRPLDINHALKGSLTLLQYKLSNITLSQHLEPVPEAMGDLVKLEQVFINILSNSLESMPEGGELSIASMSKDGMIAVRITDTGCGIAPESQLRVFEPFFTTKDVGSGTGLGLSVSYGIIKQHRGFIELSSEPGKGTTVTVRIPTKEYYEEDIDRG
jgi:two-component system NtrC family sensor kinase